MIFRKTSLISWKKGGLEIFSFSTAGGEMRYFVAQVLIEGVIEEFATPTSLMAYLEVALLRKELARVRVYDDRGGCHEVTLSPANNGDGSISWPRPLDRFARRLAQSRGGRRVCNRRSANR